MASEENGREMSLIEGRWVAREGDGLESREMDG